MPPQDASTAVSAPEGSVNPVTFFDYLFRMSPEQRDALCDRLEGQESADYARTRVVNLLREHATFTRGVDLSYKLSSISIPSGEDPDLYLWFHMSDMGQWIKRDYIEYRHKHGNHEEPTPTEEDFRLTQNAVGSLYTKVTGKNVSYMSIQEYEQRKAERKSGTNKNAQVIGK